MDPVTLAVVRGALEQIADEMDLHLIHAALSPIISIQTPAPRSMAAMGRQVLPRLSWHESPIPTRNGMKIPALERMARSHLSFTSHHTET